MNKKILNVLNSFSKKDLVLFFNEDLKKHNSFNIGGIADCFVVVNNDKTLKKIVSLPAKHFLIGAGTNLLFKKKKYSEIILKLGKNYKKIKKTFENEEKIIIEAGAGVNLFTLNLFLRNIGIPGLEWSYGIPGSIGGAIFMNAGAYEHEFGEFVYSVKILKDNKIFWTKKVLFSYRGSSFQDSDTIILAVKLILNNRKEPSEIIKEKQEGFLVKRKESQPYDKNCAGSIFKRVFKQNEIIYPAKLIDNLGLKGATIGEAEISKKHAGFIINNGNATANDVLKLINLAKNKVRKKTGIILDEEIIIV